MSTTSSSSTARLSRAQRSTLLWGAWLGSRLLVLALFLTYRNDAEGTPLGDIGLYWNWASGTDTSTDIDEYPGLAQAFIRALALGETAAGYFVTWAVLMLVCDAALLGLLWWHNERSGWVWVVGPPLLGPIAWLRLDMLVALGATLAVLLRVRQPIVSSLALAMTALLKLWAIVLIPVLVLGNRWRHWVGAGLAALGVGLTVEALVRGEEAVKPLLWQWDRGLHVESVLSTPHWIGALAGADPTTRRAFRSFQIDDAPGWLPLLGLAALIGLIAWATWRLVLLHRSLPAHAEQGLRHAQTIVAATVCVAAVTTNKVLSPQYVLWFLPVVALALPYLRRSRLATGLGLATCLLTQVVYPYLYVNMLDAGAAGTFALVGRNMAVVALLWLLVLEVRRSTDRALRTDSVPETTPEAIPGPSLGP